MKNHVIVTGLGKVGIRVVGKLHRLGEQVVIVDRDQEGRFVAEAKSMKVPMVFGDIRSAETLKQANVEAAASIVACTNDDLINLESALTARELNADIRVVLRVFDPGLAKRIQAGFGLDTAFSTSALAAPAFALAAVDPSVIGSVLLEDQLMLNVEVEVAAHSRLDGMSTAELRELGDLSILIHRSAKSGQRKLHPSGTFALAAGDTLVLCVTPEFRVPLKQLNQI